MARQWVVAGFALAALWLFVRGVALEPARLLGEYLIGLAFGLPVAFASRRFYTDTIPLRRTFRAVPYATLYVLVFVKDVLVANLDVAYRVLAPGMPIQPDILTVPLRVESDLAVTTIANSISLTPGTLTMDYDEAENVLFVHAINCTDPEAITDPIRQWEEYALVIFDEERKPGDPIPETSYDRSGADPAVEHPTEVSDDGE